MDSAKFLVALVVVIACIYLWNQRGLLSRDHEVCLDATQALTEQQAGGVGFNTAEQYQNYIDAYNSWYEYCRQSRFKRRDPEMYEFLVEESNRRDTE